MQTHSSSAQHRSRQRRSRQRRIELSWGTHVDVPGLRCLQAECPDEITQLIFAGRAIFDESDPAAILGGPMGKMAVNEHRERCVACRRWEARA